MDQEKQYTVRRAQKRPFNKFPSREWRHHPEFPGWVILDTGVHDMAALGHIFKEANCVSAFGKGQEEDFAPYSAMTANIAFKSGVVGNYTFYLNFYNAMMGLEEILVTPEVEYGDAMLLLNIIKSAHESQVIYFQDIPREKIAAPIA